MNDCLLFLFNTADSIIMASSGQMGNADWTNITIAQPMYTSVHECGNLISI